MKEVQLIPSGELHAYALGCARATSILYVRFMARHGAKVFLAGVVLAVAIFLAGAWLTASHPAAGEIFTNIVVGAFQALATIPLAALFFGIALSFWKYGREYALEEPPAPGPLDRLLWLFAVRVEHAPLLTAWAAPDIGPDYLVCNLPGEVPDELMARFTAAKEASSAARWTVVLQYRNPVGMIYGPPHDGQKAYMSFERAKPPFQEEDCPPEYRILPFGAMLTQETEVDFRQYVDRFCAPYREWAASAKIMLDSGQTGHLFERVFRAVAAPALSILLLLSASSVSAQKVAQVQRTEIANTVPPARTLVRFSFETTDCDRTADGVKTYTQLLTSIPRYEDGRGGKLLSIWAGGTVVYKAPNVERSAPPIAAANAVRPYNEAVPRPNGAGGLHLPDSATSAAMADRAMYQIWRLEQEGGQAAKPWWKVVMVAFWVLFPILLCGALIAWLCAGTFASEGMLLPHKYARRSLVFLLLFAGAVLVLNIMLSAISEGFGPGPLTILAVALGMTAKFIVTRLVPNFNPAPGNEPERMGGGYRNNTRLLG